MNSDIFQEFCQVLPNSAKALAQLNWKEFSIMTQISYMTQISDMIQISDMTQISDMIKISGMQTTHSSGNTKDLYSLAW